MEIKLNKTLWIKIGVALFACYIAFSSYDYFVYPKGTYYEGVTKMMLLVLLLTFLMNMPKLIKLCIYGFVAFFSVAGFLIRIFSGLM
ncbi:hypothetical protein PBAC_32610 [Pedobacter glucosidilyticus]|nr:hypothetical protein [Pedobacter glucosidilyticus]KHJ36559.1 hypothetical protein PBAC_32610 [Pedobacter glucosidilyticus]